jgi:hypothetical protein
MKWKPIETAPRDRTDVLVHSPKWLVPMVMNYASWEYFAREYGNPEYMEAGWYLTHATDFDQPDEYTREPTHWQPLPPPPTSPATTNEHTTPPPQPPQAPTSN